MTSHKRVRMGQQAPNAGKHSGARASFIQGTICGFLAFAWILAAQAAGAPLPMPPRDFAGVPTATPPQQTQPWRPPKTNLRKAVTQMAEGLFDLGLADPRACEFRSVFLHMHRHVQLETGWLFPPSGPNDRRYAVGWDGLLHAVVPHKPADLAKAWHLGFGWPKTISPKGGRACLSSRRSALQRGKPGSAMLRLE